MRSPVLFFGTFNPIHLGHLMMAEAVLNHLRTLGGEHEPEIWFIPTGRPPNKAYALSQQEERLHAMAPAQHRLAMVQCAVASHPRFKVLGIEAGFEARPGPHYTWETLQVLNQLYPEQVKPPYRLLMGSDTVHSLPSWQCVEALVESCEFFQVVRNSQPTPCHHIPVNGKQVSLITQAVPMPAIEVSASWVRERLIAGDSVRYWVPDEVIAYIHRHSLYVQTNTFSYA